ncbi:MAG: hypothetical protein COV10_03680 [Candidatus Vogelbacteria bacterium CG10_big_fil_rev_8_21_14_0_10_51_16]|uniref:Uncharacterized protein n=1 Tax=Candidatus Vogelbacteria bacterium CG10_big_fil_rev_8_21_14_0_10_51_16 TaxID=1975045 RepID=A0A2H0RDI7_9BACT|nr:MAG: hypothetical protein COV10_03680 [Candidatus Vogelbacteria bacterium CG10_big_fil_rev_8_21_14_0_10_51_16]
MDPIQSNQTSTTEPAKDQTGLGNLMMPATVLASGNPIGPSGTDSPSTVPATVTTATPTQAPVLAQTIVAQAPDVSSALPLGATSATSITPASPAPATEQGATTPVATNSSGGQLSPTGGVAPMPQSPEAPSISTTQVSVASSPTGSFAQSQPLANTGMAVGTSTPQAPITPVNTTGPTINNAGVLPPKQTTLTPGVDLKTQAMLAMEGDAGRQLREQEELRQKELEMRSKLEFERDQLNAHLAQVSKQKEYLELEWVKYNNQKQPLEQQLEPIVAEERATEAEERKVEQDEAVAQSTPNTQVAQIQEVEARRWATQERRHRAEEQKWAFAKQIETLATSMDSLGVEYRNILAQEDEVKKKISGAEAALKNLAAPKLS